MNTGYIFSKIKLLVMGTFLLYILAGCGQSAEQSAVTDKITAKNVYTVETSDMQITPDILPINGSLCLTGDTLYFYDNKGELYSQSLEKDSRPEKLPLQLFKEMGIADFSVDDSGISCLGNTVDGSYLFMSFDGQGELLSEVLLPQAVTKDWEQAWKMAASDAEGNIYVTVASKLFIFDKTGNPLGAVKAEAESFYGLTVGKDGKVYASYLNRKTEMILTELDVGSKKLINEVKIPVAKDLFTGITSGVCFYDNSFLYEYDPATGGYEAIVNWTEHYINADLIKGVSGENEGNLRVVTWNENAANAKVEPIWLSCLKQTTGEEKEKLDGEKEKITVFKLGFAGDLQEIIVEFNKQSSRYSVVLETCDYGDIEDMEVFANTRLMGKDCPDLIAAGAFFHTYQEAGVLEDLVPYLAASKMLSKADFMEVAMKPCQSGDAVYGLPKEFSVSSFAGRTSQVKDMLTKKGGCSVASFLTWLEENPDVKLKRMGARYDIIQYCLKYGLPEYVDFENKTCDFEGEAFRKLLEKTDAMNLEYGFNLTDWQRLIADGEKFLDEASLDNFAGIVSLEGQYGGETTYLGFPTSDGKLKTGLFVSDIMGILSRSDCKEGAWEFLEFYMLYENETQFPARKARFEEELARVSTIQYEKDEEGNQIPVPYSYYLTADDVAVPIYALTKEQVDKVLEMINCAEEVNPAKDVIVSIIGDEILPYWNKEKSLDTALDAIQNRVSLYLNE